MNVTNIDDQDLNQPLVNKIANSGLVTIDLETYYPKTEILEVNLKDFLFQGLLLKEKDFRQSVKDFDWKQFSGKHVAIHCSTDALVQQWAFMILADALAPYAESIHLGNKKDALSTIYANIISNLDVQKYQDKKVIIKGCSSKQVPDDAYLLITKKLKPVVASLMYGEACSTVPVYKKKKV